MEKIDSNNMWNNLSDEQKDEVLNMYFELMERYRECKTDVIKGQLSMLETLYGKENLERGYVEPFDFDEAIKYVWWELGFAFNKVNSKGKYVEDFDHVKELFQVIHDRGGMGDLEYLQIIQFIKVNNLSKKLS